ncbi:uncharacterized protein [Musca autumnalis]|uniref:uncharacterized protein n=1 Tax=Musca autumnalis TaxID=221902 RepID=UPI003CEF50C8
MEVQPNGELKKIYLNKPPPETRVEEKPATSRARDSRVQSSTDWVQIPPPKRRPPPADNMDEDENISNHKKQRYWNSYEEMHIIELWRRYKDEVTEFNKALPVHRKIMIGMRQKGMIVTGQDCRRKLNTLNNKYKAELESQKLTGVKSEWRLFPLIHCIKSPKIKQFDPWHETLIIRKLLEKLPKPPEPKFQPQPQIVPLKVQQPVRQCGNIIQNKAINGQNLNNASAGHLIASIPLKSIASGVSSLLAMDTCTSASIPPLPSAHITPTVRTTTRNKRTLPPLRNITKKKLEQLKLENALLAQQRDDALKDLRMAERKLRIFEMFLLDLYSQAENGVHGEN